MHTHTIIPYSQQLSLKQKVKVSLWSGLPVCSQVDAADAEVVSGADEAGLQLQRSSVGLNSLLAAVSVSKSRPQSVPQQVVLRHSGLRLLIYTHTQVVVN